MNTLTWINHAGFMIEIDSSKRIYIDPYQLDNQFKEKSADIILSTHDHHDHFDEKSVNLIKTEHTDIIIAKSCSKVLKNYKAQGISPYEEIDMQGITIKAFPAYNPNKKFHPKKNNWVGYIIKIGEKTIYHAGDTDLIPEFKDLENKIDIALLPVGDTYTMGFKDAIEAVKIIKPKIIVPHHHWDADLNEFKEKCEKEYPQVQVEILTEKNLIF